MSYSIKLKDREDDSILSNDGLGETFANILRRNLTRRGFLKAAAASSAVAAVSATSFSKMVLSAEKMSTNGFPLGFTPIQGNTTDTIDVPAHHNSKVLIRWGDPILPGAQGEFDPTTLTGAEQEKRFGYNCDFVGYYPFQVGSVNSNQGLLVVNHEYTTSELLFPNYNIDKMSQQRVDVEMAAHGVSVVEISKDSHGQWQYHLNSPFNRRLTVNTPMLVTGPAAAHSWLKTSTEPTGMQLKGTINNCSGGKTPWGTVLTAEENFQLYFGNQSLMEEGEVKDVHGRYGLEKEKPAYYRWMNYYDRFDASKEPNEPFRFGWVVEFDPYDPTWTPRKRTALGRFRHEAATVVVTRNNQIVVYSGDDQRFEYLYKFVSAEKYNPNNRFANRDGDILNSGTLYVAKFNDDGTGQWLPLVYGQNGLQGTVTIGEKEYTFNSQADVLLKTRLAADYLGATRMDRPEDVEANPVTGKVYVALTNNNQRESPNAANPQAPNNNGHILELTEHNNDQASLTFTWNIFIICGRPEDNHTTFAGFPKEQLNKAFSGIAAPDNVTFDDQGNLWVTTDGQPSSSRLGLNDGIFAVPVSGAQRGHIGQFMCSAVDSEVCGPEFTPDNRTLFLAIQHPGEGSSYENPSSRWPDYTATMPPRPSVIAIQAISPDGRLGAEKVGQLRVAEAPAPAPTAAPTEPSIMPPAAPAEEEAVTPPIDKAKKIFKVLKKQLFK